jgi:signal peptidase I
MTKLVSGTCRNLRRLTAVGRRGASQWTRPFRFPACRRPSPMIRGLCLSTRSACGHEEARVRRVRRLRASAVPASPLAARRRQRPGRPGRTSRRSSSPWRSSWSSGRSSSRRTAFPSGSMIPTLLVGDWLFVNKLAYGPHVPFTDINLPGYDEPERGDVVVFVSPNQIDQPERSHAHAREAARGRGRRYGVDARRPVLPERHAAAAGLRGVAESGGRRRVLRIRSSSGRRRSRCAAPTPAIRPPPHARRLGAARGAAGLLFMLGDNRYDSKDGRYWGLVPRENVRGRPVFVYYSYRADESDRSAPVPHRHPVGADRDDHPVMRAVAARVAW